MNNLVDLLRYRAEKQPDDVLYTFLSDQQNQVEKRTYKQLDQVAKLIACHLQKLNIKGGRALLLYPSGLSFIEAFFGCLYAGVIAVPAYPPRKNQKLERLQSIIDNCQPDVVLCSEGVQGIAKPLLDNALHSSLDTMVGDLYWLNTDSLGINHVLLGDVNTSSSNSNSYGANVNNTDIIDLSLWEEIQVSPSDLAFLQYTSGSTGDPKGVMISHENIMANEEMICNAFGFTAQHNFASWLPMFHDMGLIGTTLHPLYLGSSSVLMTPASFLRQPFRWLKAISDYRAKVSVAPNFAYELCVDQITEEQRASLDLSCWTHALCGSEPVRINTLRSFCDTFSKQGFAWDAFYPVYGMAETTLIITGGGTSDRPRVETVSAQELALNEFRVLSSHELEEKRNSHDAMDFVGVGETILQQKVAIVDPDSSQECEPGRIGEIWVSGKNVGQGYWNNAELSQKTFKAKIKAEDNTWQPGFYLRTGDLGCYIENELFITGRSKEIIIIRGRNYYPYDIELVAQQSHFALKVDSAAAFPVNVRDQEQIVLFIEVERKYRLKVNIDEVANAVRKAVAREYGLQVYGVCLLKPGRILKTSSGKIQRGACKRAFENESIEFIAQSLKLPSIESHLQTVFINRDDLHDLSYADQHQKIITYWRESAAMLLQLDSSEVPTEQALTSLGLDSLQVTQLVSRVREHLEIELAIDELFELDSLSELADLTLKYIQKEPSPSLPDIQPFLGTEEIALSFSQKRLWFLDQLEPGNSAYNNPAALYIRGKLDIRILEYCLEEIARRHSVLRTKVIAFNGEGFPVIESAKPWHLPVEDLSSLSVSARHVEMKCLVAEEAVCTFDLSKGGLFRTRLLQLGELDSEDETYILLLTAHHIVSDGGSLKILISELAELYSAFSAGKPSPMLDLPIQYYDFARWQRSWLRDDVLHRQLSYWKGVLLNVPSLELPLDYPRPPTMSLRGKQINFEISEELFNQLKALSQSQGVTPFMTLFSSFAVLLSRYSGQEDFAIGTPIANRTRAELEGLIGFFVNTLALRVDLSGQPTFLELLKRIQGMTLEAYTNQDLPFERLVDELGLVRDMSHTPLFQVMFVFQNASHHFDIKLEGVEFEVMQVHGQTSKFDLSLDLREVNTHIEGFIEYSSDIFDELTIQSLADNFLSLLNKIVSEPEKNISNYEFLSSTEITYLLNDLNNNIDMSGSHDVCIPTLFEQQCQNTLNTSAVIFKNEVLSFDQLNKKANQLARYLIDKGVKTENLVGICATRNQNLPIILLGVLKASAAYVPLDPKYPRARLEEIINAAQMNFLLVDANCRDSLPDNTAQLLYIDDFFDDLVNYDSSNLDITISSQQLAYVIYTSGSTGVPKGVAIEHRNTVALLNWAKQQYSASELELVLASTSICFDLSIFELFVPLITGGTICLVDSIFDLLSDRPCNVSLINTVPSAIAMLDSANKIPTSVRTINLAGEALQSELVDQLYETGHVEKVYDLYGPSEDTTYSTCMLRERFSHASIGRPITNTQAYILDNNLKPVPQGVVGNLYLGGSGLARGYYQEDALTQKQFIANPFHAHEKCSKTFGDRIYDTGDLARYLTNGEIEYLGRSDFQVKLRGFRIELGEIQSALSRIKNIYTSLVVIRDDVIFSGDVKAKNNEVLVAYIVFKQGLELEPKAANSFLRNKLKSIFPSYMVPTVFVSLDEIPLTPNGKTDRSLLPIPDLKSLVSKDYQEANNAFEQGLIEIWSDVLSLHRISIHDNFFEIGGHSLLATQVVARIRDTFKVDLSLKTLFEQSTIFELAALISQSSNDKKSDFIKIAQFPRQSQHRSESELSPLSFAQQRLWFLHLLDKESAAYNMPAKLSIHGSLDISALENAFITLVDRHEVLRTLFVLENNQIFQKIQNTPKQWLFEKIDLEDEKALDLKSINDYFNKFSQQAFDLENIDINQPEKRLIRCSLMSLSENHHVLMINMHHIISDGWSMGIVLKELKSVYESISHNQPLQLTPISVHYTDYAVWQRQWLKGDRLEQQLHYWKEQLLDVSVLELPNDRPRKAIQSYSGARIPFQLSSELCSKLYRQTREQNATLFMVMLAGFKTLLFRYTGQHDIAVGTPLANRTHPEWESLIGFFVNTLVLRSQIREEDSFIDVVNKVQSVTLDAYANQDIPFDKLVEELNIQRNNSHSPLFQAAFTLQIKAISESLVIDNLSVDVSAGNTQTAKFDITMEMQERDGSLFGELEYNTDLFDRATMEDFVLRYETLLIALLDSPRQSISKLSLLSSTEKADLVEETRQKKDEVSDLNFVHHIFEAQAEKTPHIIALKDEVRTITYGELNIEANRLANYLSEKGLQGTHLLPLFIDRSIEMVVSILACLKVGAAYVPIDPMIPDDRVSYILNDVFSTQQSALLLTQESLARRIDTSLPELTILCIEEPHNSDNLSEKNIKSTHHSLNDPAYVIYTSGTTGNPKGVVVSHLNLSRLFKRSESLFDFNQKDVWTLFHSFSFDFSVWELWGALLYGGKLVIVSQNSSRNSEAFYDLLAEEKVTILNQTPSAFHQLVKLHTSSSSRTHDLSLRKVIFGGEKLDIASLKPWTDHFGFDVPELINMYGITETTVHVTCHRIRKEDLRSHRSLIGHALPDLKTFILDNFLQPVPKGIVGELFIGGSGVSQGYLNRESLNRERFFNLTIPEVGEQFVYRTGDLVRRLYDGGLEYLGRIDEQVKIRGFRIELGEIQHNINAIKRVKESIVLVKPDNQGNDAIVAYIVMDTMEDFNSSNIRSTLMTLLPDYMIPKAFVVLEGLPLLSNGKLNKKALVEPDWTNLSDREYISPRNKTETILSDIWKEVLQLERIGIYDDFFEIGGHSLLATQIVSRIRDSLELELPLNIIFETPTIADIAFYLIEQEALEADHELLESMLEELENTGDTHDDTLSDATEKALLNNISSKD